MKVSITISFEFNDRCKDLIKTIHEKQSLIYETKINDKTNLYDGNFEDLVRLEIFGMIGSSEEYEDQETIIYKCWLTTVGKAFYMELFENEY